MPTKTTTKAPRTAAVPSGTLQHVAPGDLLLERNIRDGQPSAELIASVRDVGVLQPITAVRAADDRLLVRYGQRRTLAALEAGLATVPVYVTGADDTATPAEIHRIIAQRDENTHRAGLTAADEIGVVEQLAAFGLSAEEISAQARIQHDRVDTALSVSRSKLAAKTATKYEQLTLDQVAAIAEFDDDAEVAKDLIVTAIKDPARFVHVLQRRRDDRALASASTAAVSELEAAGVKVVDAPYYGSSSKAAALDHLVDAKGQNLTEKNHAGCAGAVAWVTTNLVWTKSDDGADVRSPKARVTHGCSNPSKYGHKDRYSSSSNKPAAADMSEEQREKAKVARRLVIDNNKAWASAQVVRREWLAEFAKRKTPPKGAAAFIAQTLAGERMWLSDYRVPAIVVELLGGTASTSLEAHVAKLLKGATENRAQVIALAQILAAIEAITSQQTWRENGTKSTGGRYLRFLESAGYALSDVEKYACSSKKPY